MGEFEENPYEVNTKDSLPYRYYDHKDRLRPRPSTHASDSRERSLSFSYGDYRAGNEVYSKLEDYHRPKRDSTLPIYDDLRSKPRRPFGLTNYGHLKIDYSYNWNSLNKYVCN